MKRLHLSLFILLCIGQTSFAQFAPNFNITDQFGQDHNLYIDYLNQGKTVVLEIMFTTCPPCNNFAPFLEPMYQSWGGGIHDVQFFLLSDKNSDSNASVGNWANSHGVSIPGSGEDGGGFLATQPYVMGQFGPFFGTPAIIVIAPNGAVQSNVGFGLTGEAKVNAIDFSITITGAAKPPLPTPVEGVVKMPNNNVIPGVSLQMFPFDSTTAISDTIGDFDYIAQLPPDSTNIFLVQKDSNDLNGVSTFDLVFMLKHILGVQALNSKFQEVAADVNNTRTVTTADMVEVRRLILHIDTAFKYVNSWRFVDFNCEPFSTPPPSDCGVDSVFTFVTSSIAFNNLKIVGVKMGDVNYSANPMGLIGAEERDFKGVLEFHLPNKYLQAGEEVVIPLQVKELQEVLGYQFTFEFDTEALQFAGYEPINLNLQEEHFNFQKIEDGIITTNWFDIQPHFFTADAPLFELKFKVKQAAQLQDLVQISSKYTTAEAYSGTEELLDVQLLFDNDFEVSNTQFTLLPNPVSKRGILQFQLEERSNYSFEIVNIMGQQMQVLDNVFYEKGTHQQVFDFSNLNAGVYFVNVKKEGDLHKIIKFVKN